MVLVLTAILAFLALVTLGYAVLLAASRVLQRSRSRRHNGVYRVRVGPAAGRGIDGVDLGGDVATLDEARTLAKGHLLSTDVGDGVVAFVLAGRDDGQWDVVDRIDVVIN